jgi:hypothetical protein
MPREIIPHTDTTANTRTPVCKGHGVAMFYRKIGVRINLNVVCAFIF